MAASMVASCGSDDGAHACTDLFAFITATAINGSGQPVSNLAIRDSVIRTATGFGVSQEGILNTAGTIVVFSDSYLANVAESGDPVLVSGTGAGLGFAAGFQFGSDGCHVRKISGPDTVVVH